MNIRNQEVGLNLSFLRLNPKSLEVHHLGARGERLKTERERALIFLNRSGQ